jgi:hypothetical protein
MNNMVVYSKLGKKGNLGNQLFQIASTIGIAVRNKKKYAFPNWKYANYFTFQFPLYNPELEYQIIQETTHNYSSINLKNGNFNLNGWFQSEKYFDIDSVKKCFEFRPEIVLEVKEKYKKALEKRNILISIRRGDFVSHPYYFQLDYSYYFLGIVENFPDWKERNLIFTSDDIGYCKNHFKFLSNAIFVEKSNVIEQLVLGSLCNDFVISNSTFSWWQAWLGENQTTKIICPIQNFRGKFRARNKDDDYFPDRWIRFNSKLHKVDTLYLSLILKGEILKLIDKIIYFKKFVLKKTKKQIKFIICRK